MASPVLGRIDEATRTRLRGWACDGRRPDRPVSLLVTLDGALLGRVVANRFRQDLLEAGLGSGRHGFELDFADALSPLRPHLIRVAVEEDGSDLPHSPWVLQPAERLAQADLAHLSALLRDDEAPDAASVEARISFLLGELDHLLQRNGSVSGAAGWRNARRTDAGVAANDDPEGKLALVIDEVAPVATRDAGSSAILSHMRALRRLGFRVVFAAAEPGDAARPGALEDAGIETCAPPFYASVEEAMKRHGAGATLVYLHRGSVGSRYAGLARRHCPRARLVLSIADLQHVRLARQAAAEGRTDLLPAARAARSMEFTAMREADAVLAHSTVEAKAIAAVLPGKPVHTVMWAPCTRPVATPFAARYGVAFLADYAHAPNLDAARRLVHEIMPLVWEHDPTLPCLLAGSRLPHGFGAGDSRVRWIGHVPVLQSLFERVRLSVAPLLFGAGVKGKVLESLAAGVPCVCSPIAAEGLGLTAELDRLVAGDTHGIARLVLQLHRDSRENAALADAGLCWARQHLSDGAIETGLRAAMAG